MAQVYLLMQCHYRPTTHMQIRYANLLHHQATCQYHLPHIATPQDTTPHATTPHTTRHHAAYPSSSMTRVPITSHNSYDVWYAIRDSVTLASALAGLYAPYVPGRIFGQRQKAALISLYIITHCFSFALLEVCVTIVIGRTSLI